MKKNKQCNERTKTNDGTGKKNVAREKERNRPTVQNRESFMHCIIAHNMLMCCVNNFISYRICALLWRDSIFAFALVFGRFKVAFRPQRNMLLVDDSAIRSRSLSRPCERFDVCVYFSHSFSQSRICFRPTREIDFLCAHRAPWPVVRSCFLSLTCR